MTLFPADEKSIPAFADENKRTPVRGILEHNPNDIVFQKTISGLLL
jgi:hypothetical protein